MKRIFSILLIGVCMLASARAQEASNGDDPDIAYAAELLKPGTKAPDFSIPGPDGKLVKLSKFRGKYVVLDFWASWCPDCRKELPAIEKAYEQFSKSGVVFIGVSFDDNKDKWTEAIKDFGLKYPQVSELKKWKQTEVSPLYKIKWIPTIYLIDPKGKVVLGTVVTDKVLDKLAEITK